MTCYDDVITSTHTNRKGINMAATQQNLDFSQTAASFASPQVARKATRYVVEDRVKLVAWNPHGNVRTFIVRGDTGRWPVIVDVEGDSTMCACPSGRRQPVTENGPICSHVLAAMCYWTNELPELPDHEPPAHTSSGVRCGRCTPRAARGDDVIYHATAADVRICHQLCALLS